MMAHVGHTNEHDGKQDDIGNKCDNSAESNALQVGDHTVFVAPCSMELWINQIQVRIDDI